MDREMLGRAAARRTAVFAAALALLVLLPAGLLAWTPWLFWIHVMLWSAGLTLYFYRHDPALLARRMTSGPAAEKEPEQKRIQTINAIALLAMTLVSAFDCRFQWSAPPTLFVVLGHALIAAGFLFVFVVLRENSFASTIVRVEDGQRVISTGPYALVRHPMYAGAIAIFIGAPLALSSFSGLLFTPVLLWGLVARLTHEEQILANELRGYDDYRARVRYRLAPGVW